MPSCPVDECKEMRGIKKTLYGGEGMTGIVGCMKKYVTKRAMWLALVSIGLPLIVTGVKVWSGQEADPLKYAKKETVNSLDKRTLVLEERQANITKSLDEIKETMEKNKDELLDALKDLKE